MKNLFLALSVVLIGSAAKADVTIDPEQFAKPKHGIAYKLTHLGLIHAAAKLGGKLTYYPIVGLTLAYYTAKDFIEEPVLDATYLYHHSDFVSF